MKTRTLVLVVGLIGGCGGSSGGGGSVSVNDFPQRAATAICSQNFKCCDAAELAGKTMADCVSSNQLFLSALSSEISASQSKGRATYNAAQMGTCINSFATLTCAQWKSGSGDSIMGSAACTATITPKVANGGACQQDFECTSGSCVGADTSATPPVDGTCMAAPAAIAVGQPCSGSDVCVSTAYCDFTSGTCKTSKAVGDTCASSDECVSTAYCDTASGTCKTRKAGGETCGSSDECVNDCNFDTGTCTCYVGCSVGGPVTPGGTLLAFALLGLAIGGARLGRRRRRSLGERARQRG